MSTRIFKCPHCKQHMGEGQLGPNFAALDAPGVMTGGVYALVCVNVNCQAVLGAYFVPATS